MEDNPRPKRDLLEGVIPVGAFMAFVMMVLAVIVGLWLAKKVGVGA